MAVCGERRWSRLNGQARSGVAAWAAARSSRQGGLPRSTGNAVQTPPLVTPGFQVVPGLSVFPPCAYNQLPNHMHNLPTHFFTIHPSRPLHARPSTASLDPPIVGHRSCATIHALPSGRELVVGAHRRLASRVSALATVKARGRNGGPPTSGPTHPNLAHRRPARVPLEHIRLDQRSTYRLTRHLLPADARSPSMGRLPD